MVDIKTFVVALILCVHLLHLLRAKIWIHLMIRLCLHMLVWCKLPVDDLKKIEYAQSLNGLYVEVCILTAVHMLVLTIK